MQLPATLAPIDILTELAKQLTIELPDLSFKRPERAGPDFTPQLIQGVSEAAYHTDLACVARGDLLSFMKTPAHFVARRRQPYEVSTKSQTLRFGRAAHVLILEPEKFRDLFQIIPSFGPLQSPANRAKKAAWFSELPPEACAVTLEEMTTLFGMVRALISHQDARDLLMEGVAEASGYYADPVTGLKLRIRPDFIKHTIGALIDFKTTIDASSEAFQRSFWKYRYDFQLAMYAEGVRLITGRDPKFVAIVAMEKKPPYRCEVYTYDKSELRLGYEDYRKALDGLAVCLDSDTWPCSNGKAKQMFLPKYAESQFNSSAKQEDPSDDPENPLTPETEYEQADPAGEP